MSGAVANAESPSLVPQGSFATTPLLSLCQGVPMVGLRVIGESLGGGRMCPLLAAVDPLDGGRPISSFSARAQGIMAFYAEGAILMLLLASVLGLMERWTGSLVPSEPALCGLTSLMGGALLALVGYVLFWLWFFSKTAGTCAGWGVLTLGIGYGAANLAKRSKFKAPLVPWLLAVIVGSVYVCMLFAFQSRGWDHSAAQRFDAGMPSDNTIPGSLAGCLIAGESPKGFFGEWLSSDRPPLQSGWVLLSWPLLRGLGFDLQTAAAASGAWFQLFWIPAIWTLAESLGLGRRKSAYVAFAATPLGFLLFNTVYVWPKLAAASFVIGGASLLLRERNPTWGDRDSMWRHATAGLMMGLGLLSHGGAAFAVLPILALLICRPGRRRSLFAVVGGILILALPWAAYQHFYDPPGNRLLKWHLAGVVPIDGRGFVETLVAQYQSVGWPYIVWARHANLWIQGVGEWSNMAVLSSSQARRGLEVVYYLRSCGWFLPAGIAAWGWVALCKRSESGLRFRAAGQWAVWCVSIWVFWLALMFIPVSAMAHQGPYMIPLVLYGLLLAGIFTAWPRLSWVIVAVQAVYFVSTWLPAAPGYLELIRGG